MHNDLTAVLVCDKTQDRQSSFTTYYTKCMMSVLNKLAVCEGSTCQHLVTLAWVSNTAQASLISASPHDMYQSILLHAAMSYTHFSLICFALRCITTLHAASQHCRWCADVKTALEMLTEQLQAGHYLLDCSVPVTSAIVKTSRPAASKPTINHCINR